MRKGQLSLSRSRTSAVAMSWPRRKLAPAWTANDGPRQLSYRAAGSLDLFARGFRELMRRDLECTIQIAVTQDLDWTLEVLDQAGFEQTLRV